MLPISQRLNKTFDKVLLKSDGLAEWDTLLQQVVFGYKSKHTNTKLFPFHLMYERGML